MMCAGPFPRDEFRVSRSTCFRRKKRPEYEPGDRCRGGRRGRDVPDRRWGFHQAWRIRRWRRSRGQAAGNINDGVIEHAHAREDQERRLPGRLRREEQCTRVCRNPQHRHQQGSFVLAVAVLVSEGFAGRMRNYARFAKLDSGIANFPVQILEDGAAAFSSGNAFPAINLPTRDFRSAARNLFVDDLPIFRRLGATSHRWKK